MKAPIVGLTAILTLLLCAPRVNAGGAAHTRPGGSGGGGHVSGSSGSHSTASRPSGSSPTRVSGHASYGYGGGGGGGGGYVSYPGYPYYGGYWGDWGWGWYGGGWGAPLYSPYSPYATGLWWPPAGYYVGMQPQTVTFSGARGSAPAVVETDIEPRKASVRIDGEEVGRAKDFNGTWDRLTIPAGRRTLEFSAPGYMTLSTTIRLDPGKYYRIDQTLQKGSGIDPRSQSAPPEPEPLAQAQESAPHSSGATLQRGLLKIAADPPDAAVYLDGEFLASARELDALHGAIPVAVGQHEVEVTHPKMKSRTLRVEVSGGDPVHVDLRMGEQQQQ